MCLVFFDFDRTLTTRDTILPLGLFLSRAGPGARSKTARFLWALLLLKGRVLSNHEFKEKFCRWLVKGKSQEDIETLARSFANRYVAGRLNPAVVQKLNEHRKRGDEVYIVSSNFRFLLEAMMEHLRTNGVIATELEILDGRYTGNLLGRACSGSEKLSRVLTRFGRERVEEAVAYGDSADDRCLLQYVKTGVWV
jgi:phosphatidylglycerophosphatase C